MATVETTRDLCDPKRCSSDEALRIARVRATEDQSYDLQIAQFLNTQLVSRQTDIAVVERAIEILSVIAPAARMFGVLRATMSQDDPGIRSKSALALARHTNSLPILQKLVSDGDARVRADTIEAMWGRRLPEVEPIFERALKDVNHRVAVNAAYALYLLDPSKNVSEVGRFVAHTEARYRAAAAWLIRRIGDIQLLGLLKPLVRDESAEVRHAAFRTLSELRAAKAVAR